MNEFLKDVPLFSELPGSDLDRLCSLAAGMRLEPGETLFEEGATGDAAYVIEQGHIEIVKDDAGSEVLLAVRGPGELIGEISLLVAAPRMATARAQDEVTLVRLDAEAFDGLLHSSPSASTSMLRTAVERWRGAEARLRQSERMAQLGTLAAGLAHELNNPASAVQRGAAALPGLEGRVDAARRALLATGPSAAQQDALDTLDARVRASARTPASLDALTRSEREEEIEERLEDAGVDEAWDVATSLAGAGFTGDEVGDLLAAWGDRTPAVATWLGRSFEQAAVVAELHEGAARISELVRSLKLYAYLDRAPVQQIDVHEGIDATLVLLRSRLRDGVDVARDYGEAVPSIQAYGSELNQVWTNLVANAVDAMDGSGTLTLRTRGLPDAVEVDVEDDGPGIPEAILPRVFDPFFTTKPPGVGTGLGLDICYNIVVHKHGGQLSVASRPGCTTFTVRLPFAPAGR